MLRKLASLLVVFVPLEGGPPGALFKGEGHWSPFQNYSPALDSAYQHYRNSTQYLVLLTYHGLCGHLSACEKSVQTTTGRESTKMSPAISTTVIDIHYIAQSPLLGIFFR